MSSASISPTVRPASARPESPRVELKDLAANHTGQVDGAWWPRSDDLADELRSLLPVLADQLGPVERVSYHLGDWSTTARSVVVDGSVVRAGGYTHQPTRTIDVATRRHRITLLVLPVDESADRAAAVMTAAARPANADTVADLLSVHS
ncbi:DUF5994 family protein [Pseudonocardia sp. N23]|uniref:DUF5994 family protein n=1 Tax=Pseudonocardia sp. N23 TaxID=1987376 RepID=UPI000BFC6F06|nr:DUF5994 family protein [Pseudonocardia sp. N23]GAY08370.1 hypothetical protein TOK_1927 [Pseudonocardia sp. N23]